MAFDDLMWKIWEIEEEIRRKRQEEETLKRRLRGLLAGREGTVKQSASTGVAEAHGVSAYELTFGKDQFQFRALDPDGKVVMRARWQRTNGNGSTDCEAGRIAVVMEQVNPQRTLEFQCSSSKSELTLNGNRLSISELEKPETVSVVNDYYVFFQDFLVAVVKNMQARQLARASGGNGDDDDDDDDDDEKTAVDVISDIACACSGFGWIGLAICGPTCLGMIIAKAADP